jgi:hypothetical protein
MPQRSQRHLREAQGRIVTITGISPDTTSITAAGAVGRTVAALSVTGGTAPITYTIDNAGSLSLGITGNLLQTAADPVGAVGDTTVGITATDSVGQTLTENIAVTVT